MFSISQIILFILIFILVGGSAVVYYSLIKGVKQKTKFSLVIYTAPLLFILFILSEITYFIYYSKFLYYFGVNALLLMLVSFVILFIPVLGFLPGEFALRFKNILKRKQIEKTVSTTADVSEIKDIAPAKSVPEELRIAETLIDEPIPEVILRDEIVPVITVTPDFNAYEEDETITIEFASETSPVTDIEPAFTEPQKEVPGTAEVKKTQTKKKEPKKTELKKTEVKKSAAVKKDPGKTEGKKTGAKPVEAKHTEPKHSETKPEEAKLQDEKPVDVKPVVEKPVKPAHPRTKQTKAADQKPKPGSPKPKTKH